MPPKRKKLVEGGEGPDGHAYYVDGDHIVHYGAGCRRLYRMTKADRGVVKGGVPVLLTEEFVENLIREHMRKETRNTGSRLSMEAADVSNEAALVAMPSGSMEERRAKRSFPSLNSDGRPERNTRAEREKALRRSWTDDLDLLDVEGDMLYKEIITSRPLSEGGDEELEDNTCTQCGGVYDYFQQPNLDRNEKADAEYYQGRGAPAEGVSFKWIKAFSDGCAAQFMCAAFFLFISSFVLTFGIFVVWNWLCSCPRKVRL